MPLRPTFCDGGTTVAFLTAASYAAWMSIPLMPLRYASAKATSELVPTIRFAYPGDDQREIQPPSLYCWTNPFTRSAASSWANSEYAGHTVRYVSQKPLFTYVWPATIFEPVVVGVSVPTFGEVGDAYWVTG